MKKHKYIATFKGYNEQPVSIGNYGEFVFKGLEEVNEAILVFLDEINAEDAKRIKKSIKIYKLVWIA